MEKFKQWLARKTEDCKTVSPLFSYKLDRKLSIIEKLRVRLHLLTCGACLNYVSNLKFLTEVIHTEKENLKSEKNHASLSTEAKERIKKAMKLESAANNFSE